MRAKGVFLVVMLFALFAQGGGVGKRILLLFARAEQGNLSSFGFCDEPGSTRPPWRAESVDQENNLRIKALGAMNRHDTNSPIRLFHIALEGGLLAAGKAQKALKRGSGILLKYLRHRQDFLNRILSVGTQTR